MESTTVIRGTGRAVRPIARCGRGKAKPTEKRPCGTCGNGFLDHHFQPFWAFTGNSEQIAREYFNSLANLCHYYELEIPESDLTFPKNVYATWQTVEKQVRLIDREHHCLILAHGRNRAVISVIKTFGLSHCLFYIPVRPYWNWLQDPQKKNLADLLTVIFAYLHQVVDIPFYAESGSFLDYQYDTLEQWVNEAGDEDMNDAEDVEWRMQQENTLYELRRAGGHMMPIIKNPDNLKRMEQVVINFHHRDERERDWETLAIEFLQLYRQYPKRSVMDSIDPQLVYPDEEERITAGEYISFYWSDKDCFRHELIEMINCSFQERPVMDEPTTVYFFDALPSPERKDFDFENRLFGLIEQLRDLLNNEDHKEHHRTI